MAEKLKYRVKREHLGDRMYFEGDERLITALDAAHLLKAGVLTEVEAKEAPKPANKARKAAPENK